MAFLPSVSTFPMFNPLDPTGPSPSGGAALARLTSPLPAMMSQFHQLAQFEISLLTMLCTLMAGSRSPGLESMTAGARSGPPRRGAGRAFDNLPFVQQPGGKSSFNIASFNVLGSSHTAAGGNKPGLDSGVERIRGAVAAMRRNNVDIAGLQEFQGDQQKAFKRLAPQFGMAAEKDNAIVWNKDKFRMVERRTVTIPYFEGNPRKMPVVQLEDKRTGKRMWVVDVHNPADTKAHPHNAANRERALRIEQDLVQKLRATGLPVFVVGDFNDRQGVDADMAQAGARSAAPRGARGAIDYVFGAGAQFSNYLMDRWPLSSGTSDHPLIVATATI